MMTNIVIGLIVVFILIIIGAVVLFIIGRRAPQTLDEQLMSSRLEDYLTSGDPINLEEIEMSQPLTERLIYPMARRLGEIVMRFTPQAALEGTSDKLEKSGMAARIDPAVFLAIQFIAAALFGGVVILVFSIGSMKLPFWAIGLIAIGLGALGFNFPTLYLQSAINRRSTSVRKAMPDALDLLTICVEAGLGFESAMAKVAEKWENELSLAFARVLQEIQLGKVRRDAMRDMADRLAVSEMTSFVAAVIQSEQLGVSLAKVLRIQSDQMRIKRRQLAEQEAQKAPIKMLIPMALLIFPSLMIVLLTPAGFQLMNAALGGMLPTN
jgi:tight adherence protein C